jgi:hypothetical protein
MPPEAGAATTSRAEADHFPGDLGMWAVIAHPGRVIQVLKQLNVLGPSADDVPDSAIVASGMTGAQVGAILDLEQPAYMALSPLPSGEMTGAFSVRLAPGEAPTRALEQHFKLETHPGGIARLVFRDKPPTTDVLRCQTAPAGDGGRRLVCADTIAELDELTPYVTRTLAHSVPLSDVHIEITAALWKQSTGQLASDASPSAQVGYREGQKFLADVSTVAIDATLDGATVDGSLTIRFTRGESPITSALLAQSSSAGPPPAAFAFLPDDSGLAIYGRGATAADLAPLRALLDTTILRTSMEEDGYSSGAIDAVQAAWDRVVLTGGPWIVATGHSVGRARDALEAYAGARKTAEAQRKVARASMQGWVLAEADDPATRWIDSIKETLRYDNLGPDKRDASGKPAARSHSHPEWKALTQFRLEPVPAGVDLPPGAAHVAARTRPNPAWAGAHAGAKAADAPEIPHVTHLFVVPDGNRTWFALSEDATLAGTVARSAIARGKAAAGGPARSAASPWEGQPTAMAGSITVAELVMLALGDTSDAELRRSRDVVGAVSTLGEAAVTPLPFWLATSPAAGGAAGGGSATLRARVPLGTLVRASLAVGKFF